MNAGKLLGILVFVLATFVAGLTVGREQIQDKWDVDKANVKQERAEAIAAAESAIREQLQAAIRLGDTLSDKLLQAESDIKKVTQEKTREIARLTTGRTCLNGAVVRLLNSPSRTTDTYHESVPETASTLDAEDGSAATDTDVAGWISFAQGEYETCRQRHGALIDYEEGKP